MRESRRHSVNSRHVIQFPSYESMGRERKSEGRPPAPTSRIYTRTVPSRRMTASLPCRTTRRRGDEYPSPPVTAAADLSTPFLCPSQTIASRPIPPHRRLPARPCATMSGPLFSPPPHPNPNTLRFFRTAFRSATSRSSLTRRASASARSAISTLMGPGPPLGPP